MGCVIRGTSYLRRNLREEGKKMVYFSVMIGLVVNFTFIVPDGIFFMDL